MQKTLRQMAREEGVELARGQLTTMGLTIILPPLGTALTFILGLTQGMPLAYLIAATALTFGGVASGMHHFSQLFYQRTPEGKLKIAAGAFGKRYDGKKLVGLKYGFNYQNFAVFPIEFEVKPLHVSLGSSINPKPQRDVVGITAPLGANGVWFEAEVPITKEMKGELMEGQFELEIIYGRPGKKRYTMVKKFKPSVKFTQQGDFEGGEYTELQ